MTEVTAFFCTFKVSMRPCTGFINSAMRQVTPKGQPRLSAKCSSATSCQLAVLLYCNVDECCFMLFVTSYSSSNLANLQILLDKSHQHESFIHIFWCINRKIVLRSDSCNFCFDDMNEISRISDNNKWYEFGNLSTGVIFHATHCIHRSLCLVKW